MKRSDKPVTAIAALALSAAMLAGALGVAWMVEHERAEASPQPSPLSDGSGDDDGFPFVDWAYWRDTNPAVIGWVTIPGTSIDHPIVQGPVEDPDYYLDHDVHGNPNSHGCPYLDADCAELGLLSPNSVIFAHHMDDGSMFSQIADFSDAAFAAKHPTILLQTPEWKATLTPRMVGIVNANSELKWTGFADDATFSAWWQEKRDDAILDLGSGETPARAYSFVTCSYNTWSNERTVVYAACAQTLRLIADEAVI